MDREFFDSMFVCLTILGVAVCLLILIKGCDNNATQFNLAAEATKRMKIEKGMETKYHCEMKETQ